MKIEKCTKEAFTVIGKEGSTADGQDFISKLWDEATEKSGEIEHLVKKDENGSPCGFWGAMSDFSRTFAPWEENFTEGLYLAGAECGDSAEPPEGWTKWVIPAFEYLYAECEDDNTFSEMIKYLQDNNISLAGAVHDFICPQTGKKYMFFPINAKV
ncbi:MAG: GyrI-like domain-containing protein [Ruminococcus sp.]|nr:GyrI-like domain-containing protein [Ruminococcus sp.]